MSLEVNIRKSFSSFTLDVAFEAGDETLGFLGASGCGKSLTMRCIAGIETPDEGRIVVNDRVFFDSERKINLTPQQRKTALLFQSYMLFPNLTVAENVAAGIGREASKADRDALVAAELKRFGLEGFDRRYPAQLSGGQQRRVAFAGVLAMEPRILVLDEPVAGLDPVAREEFLDLIAQLHGSGLTVVMVSHSMDDLARLSDRVLVLNEGRQFAFGSPTEVFAHGDELRAIGLDVPAPQKLADELRGIWNVDYDDAGAVGRRYRRQDEIGTPLCITYDFDSIEDHAVTIRERDTMEQVRIPLDTVKSYLIERLGC